MKSDERWVRVEGWPYEVSDLGRVRHTSPRGSSEPGQPTRGGRSHGYRRAKLGRGGGVGDERDVGVHRLVLEVFVGPPPTPKHEPNHINGIKDDNRPVNLEWVTKSENLRHAYEMGLIDRSGSSNNAAKLTEEEVLSIYDRAHEGLEAQGEIAGAFGTSKQVVSNIKNGWTWTSVTGHNNRRAS